MSGTFGDRPAEQAAGDPHFFGEPRALVTVVIPARNEAARLAACLASVQHQTWRNLQIVVVDGDSSDDTPEIVLRSQLADPRVELLRNPERVIPVSLNKALARARGDWLVRVDAHATIPPNYIELAVGHLRTGLWGGVGGRKEGVGETAAGRAIAAAMASRFGVGNSTYHYGDQPGPVEHLPFGCYPVELLRSLGGWDETLLVNQDFELDYRIRRSGSQLFFDPDMVINWHCRQRVPDLFRQYRRYGAGKARVAVMHPGSVRGRHLTAPALVLLLAGAAALAPARPRMAAGLVVPYALALTAATAVTARRLPGWQSRRWLAPAFAAMHVGWGLGFLSAFGPELRAVWSDDAQPVPAAVSATRSGQDERAAESARAA